MVQKKFKLTHYRFAPSIDKGGAQVLMLEGTYHEHSRMSKYRSAILKRSMKQSFRLFFPCSEAENQAGAARGRTRPLNSRVNFLRVRRTQGVPLFLACLTGEPSGARRGFRCANAKQNVDRDARANLRAELPRFVGLLRGQAIKEGNLGAVAGLVALDSAGPKSPAPRDQVIEFHGDSGVTKNSAKFAQNPTPIACGALKGPANRRRSNFGASDTNADRVFRVRLQKWSAGILPAWEATFAQKRAGCARSDFGIFVHRRRGGAPAPRPAFALRARSASQGKEQKNNRRRTGRISGACSACYARVQTADCLGFGEHNR